MDLNSYGHITMLSAVQRTLEDILRKKFIENLEKQKPSVRVRKHF